MYHASDNVAANAMLDGFSPDCISLVRRRVLPSWCLHSWLVMIGQRSEYYSSIGKWVAFQDLVWFGRRCMMGLIDTLKSRLSFLGIALRTKLEKRGPRPSPPAQGSDLHVPFYLNSLRHVPMSPCKGLLGLLSTSS